MNPLQLIGFLKRCLEKSFGWMTKGTKIDATSPPKDANSQNRVRERRMWRWHRSDGGGGTDLMVAVVDFRRWRHRWWRWRDGAKSVDGGGFHLHVFSDVCERTTQAIRQFSIFAF